MEDQQLSPEVKIRLTRWGHEISGKPELHHYPPQPLRTWLGNVKDGLTADTAFEALRYHATPLQGEKRVSNPHPDPTGWGNPFARERDWTDIPVVGPVDHFVFPEHRTIVNTTRYGHLAHPGNVIRKIVQEGDDIYVVTEGYGAGIEKEFNEKWGPRLWWLVDLQMRNALRRSSSRFNPPDLQSGFEADTDPPRQGALGSSGTVLPRPPLIDLP